MELKQSKEFFSEKKTVLRYYEQKTEMEFQRSYQFQNTISFEFDMSWIASTYDRIGSIFP